MGQYMNLREAAEWCGVSTQTIRRRRDALVAAGATVERTGWKVTASQLEQVGLSPKTEPATGSAQPAEDPRVADLLARVKTLEADRSRLERLENDRARQDREFAEARSLIDGFKRQIEDVKNPEQSPRTVEGEVVPAVPRPFEQEPEHSPEVGHVPAPQRHRRFFDWLLGR